MLRPAGFDPHLFVEQCKKDKERIKELMLADGQNGASTAGAYLSIQLSNFLWCFPLDAQQIGGKYHPEFRDFATVAIGLYAAAAGISEDDILAQENLAAGFGSRFKGEPFDPEHTFLAGRNVTNTSAGYDLFDSGLIRSRGDAWPYC